MKKNVLVLFGGISSEHEISCISASNVIENLNKSKYAIKNIGIDKKGNWYYYSGNIQNIRNGMWNNDLINKKFVENIQNELKKYDVVFPVLHGKYGEDGTLQGLIEQAGVKYVGCKVLGSSIAMDKTLSKELVSSLGIDVVPYLNLKSSEFYSKDFNYDEFLEIIEKNIYFPLIVKPNQEGSSYGVCKVNNKNELFGIIDYVFSFDKEILIEKYINSKKEVECSVLENVNKNKIYVSTPGEVAISNDVYDYSSKYEDLKTDILIPATISNEQTIKIKEYARKIFKKLRLNSLARIDFFVTKDKVYFNEVNSMPGFTSKSMYPMLIKSDGISYQMLLDILILNSIEE